MGMTVQKLIDELMKVEDKSKPVRGKIQFDYNEILGKDVVAALDCEEDVLIMLKGKLRWNAI